MSYRTSLSTYLAYCPDCGVNEHDSRQLYFPKISDILALLDYNALRNTTRFPAIWFTGRNAGTVTL